MKELVCNYAIARFRPYRETGEFANVGIVVLCPEVDYFGYAFERRKYKRITDFFPELDIDIFKAGLDGLLKELGRVNGLKRETDQLVLGGEAQARIAVFKELVRPREALFHFGEVGTTLAIDPKEKLKQLFKYYVERQFAAQHEYQEVVMRRELCDFLQQANLARFYRQDYRIGDDNYNVHLPFVYLEGNTPRKAIKPLHLDKPATTDIYRHGDAWVSTIRRLTALNRLPKEFLFTVRGPTGDLKCEAAAQEICSELEKNGTRTVQFADRVAIEQFARI